MRSLLILFLSVSISAFDIGPLITDYYVSSNRRVGSSVRESMIAQMPEPDLEVTNSVIKSKECKKIKEIRTKISREIWQSHSDICRKLRIRIKKEAYLAKGNLVEYQALDCTKVVSARVYYCEEISNIK